MSDKIDYLGEVGMTFSVGRLVDFLDIIRMDAKLGMEDTIANLFLALLRDARDETGVFIEVVDDPNCTFNFLRWKDDTDHIVQNSGITEVEEV